MDQMIGTYRGGLVVLDEPADWPEGARVFVTPPTELRGLTEDEWPTTPEGVAELLRRIDAIEPLDLTPADEAEIAAAREAVRQKTLEAVRRKMGLETSTILECGSLLPLSIAAPTRPKAAASRRTP